MAQEIVSALPGTHCAIGQHRIAEVIFGMHCPEGIVGARLAPRLGVVAVHIASTRYLGACPYQHTLLRGIGVTLGMPKVGRKPQALAAKIQPQYGHFAVHLLVVPFGIARLFHRVQTHAELLLFTEPSPYVNGPAYLARRGVAAGELGDRRVASAFGLDVDAAADATPWRNAVDQLAGALDDVDPFGHLHIDRIGRQQAIEAVVGHITVIQAETANGELLETPTGRVGGTNRRVAGDQFAQGAGLLVLHEVAGVTGDAERRFHEIARTQQALRALAGDLPACIRGCLVGRR